MGGLHIEMAMLKLIGHWLDGSGWTYVMTSPNVTTDGVIKLQQLCSFWFTGHMLSINSTHQTMSNDTMMSGASRWRPSIFSSTTGSRFGSWKSSTYSS